MKSILPPINIHIWGGLGSQLFAYALSLDLKKRYPSRRQRFVFHSSGVSRRNPELLDLVKLHNFEFIDDFKAGESIGRQLSAANKNRLGQFFKVILKSFGILATANDDSEFTKIQRWVISFRGHYSYRHVDQAFFLHLEELLSQRLMESAVDYSDALVIHYRLGDLVGLGEKRPDHAQAVSLEITKSFSNWKSNNCVVFSDSPVLAKKLLVLKAYMNPSFPKVNTIQALIGCSRSLYFIGTSSKLSFWAVALRSNVHQLPSSLPRRQRHSVSGLVGDSTLVSYF